MTDTELIDAVEKHGIQVWPMRARKHPFEPDTTDRVRRQPGDILNWTAQFPEPFIQMTRATFRAAVTDLLEAKRKLDQPNLI